MGCWSESCAISGMEIRPHDKMYMAVVAPSEYGSKTELVVPPVLGEYDDYGGLENGEAASFWGIKANQEWRPRSERRGWPVYMRADVFDYLANIRPWLHSEKTLGGHADDKLAKCREILGRLRELDPKDHERWAIERELESAIDRSQDMLADLYEFRRGLISASEEETEVLLKFLRRAYLFKEGQNELRKRFSPRIPGPQHGGEAALIPFYDFVGALAKKVKADWDAEYGEGDEE